MDTITVNKAELIKTLEENRTEHRSIFEEAQAVYRERVIHELDRHLRDAREGRKISRYVSLPEPEDHTRDFDTAIAMLNWHTEDTVDLTLREFAQYVENKWTWRESFRANTMSYSQRLDAAEYDE